MAMTGGFATNVRRLVMRRFWTADQHFGHSRVIEFCDRPFKSNHHMNKRLIDGANQRVTEDDVCVSVGDLMMGGNGSRFKMWRDMLNGHWVFLEGNHDKNNKVKTIGKSMFTKISHFNVFVDHIPYFYTEGLFEGIRYWHDPELIAYVEKTCDFAICGHVHEKWKHSTESKIPCINVGVDQWDFMPVGDDEVVNYYLKIKA